LPSTTGTKKLAHNRKLLLQPNIGGDKLEDQWLTEINRNINPSPFATAQSIWKPKHGPTFWENVPNKKYFSNLFKIKLFYKKNLF